MYKLENVIQKVEDFLREYTYLLFSVVSFISGIKDILNNEEKPSSGWFMVILSLGWFVKYLEDNSTNKRLKMVCKFISYGILACIFIWFVAVIIL